MQLLLKFSNGEVSNIQILQIYKYFKYSNALEIQIFKCFKPVFLFAASEDLTGLQLLLYNKPEKDIRLIPVNALQFWQS